jgi:hypothetical protein
MPVFLKHFINGDYSWYLSRFAAKPNVAFFPYKLYASFIDIGMPKRGGK